MLKKFRLELARTRQTLPPDISDYIDRIKRDRGL